MDFCNKSFCDYEFNDWLSNQLEETYTSLRASQWTTIIILTVFLVSVFLVGSTGNILVLIVFAKNKTKQTATVFIMALATTDLTICLVVLPGVLIKEWYVPFRWDALCRGWELVRCATIPLSSLILVIVAVDRYIMICKVGHFQAISTKEARWILIGIIVCSIGLGIPPMLRVGVYQEGSSPGDPPEYLGLCISNDFLITKPSVDHYWQAMAAKFFLVLVTVIVLYSSIFHTVYQQGLWHPAATHSDAASVSRHDASKAPEETSNIATATKQRIVTTDGPNLEEHKLTTSKLEQHKLRTDCPNLEQYKLHVTTDGPNLEHVTTDGPNLVQVTTDGPNKGHHKVMNNAPIPENSNVMRDDPSFRHHKGDTRIPAQLSERQSNNCPYSTRETKPTEEIMINIAQVNTIESQVSLNAAPTTLLVTEAASPHQQNVPEPPQTNQLMHCYPWQPSVPLNKMSALQTDADNNVYNQNTDTDILSACDDGQHGSHSTRGRHNSYQQIFNDRNEQLATGHNYLNESCQNELIQHNESGQNELIQHTESGQNEFIQHTESGQNEFIQHNETETNPNNIPLNKLMPEMHKESMLPHGGQSNTSQTNTPRVGQSHTLHVGQFGDPQEGHSVMKCSSLFKRLFQTKVHPLQPANTTVLQTPTTGKSSRTGAVKFQRYHITDARQKRIWTAQVKTAKVLLMVTVVYVLSFAPVLLMTVNAIPSHRIPFYTYFLHSAANPLIYSFTNPTFRLQLMKLLKCRRWSE